MKKYTQEEIDALIVVKDGYKYIINKSFNNCDLSYLDLSDIIFQDCSCLNANFRFTNLKNADLFDVAGLDNSILEGAYLKGTIFDPRATEDATGLKYEPIKWDKGWD